MKFIIYNYNLKRIINRLWKSNFINNNLFYKKLLNRQIDKKINQYKDKPFCVRVENTNICNSKCIMCPRDSMTRAQGVMSDVVFNNIIDQCAEFGIGYINLHNFGEPLIDKDLANKISYAKNKKIKKVTTNTNASLLEPEVSRSLIESGLDELFVSIDAAKKDTYEKVRVGLNYDKLLDNLINFLSVRKEISGKTKIIVSFVNFDQDSKEVKDFINFWKNKADYVSVSYAHNWVGSKKDALDTMRLNYPCRLLFSDLTIAWNGDYILCCADYNSEVVLGNIKNDSLIAIWRNNGILNNYRSAHLSRKSHKLNICNQCTLNTIWWF